MTPSRIRSTSTVRSANSRPSIEPPWPSETSSASTTPRSPRSSTSPREPCVPASRAVGPRSHPNWRPVTSVGTKRHRPNIQLPERYEHPAPTAEPRNPRRAVERRHRRRARSRRHRARAHSRRRTHRDQHRGRDRAPRRTGRGARSPRGHTRARSRARITVRRGGARNFRARRPRNRADSLAAARASGPIGLAPVGRRRRGRCGRRRDHRGHRLEPGPANSQATSEKAAASAGTTTPSRHASPKPSTFGDVSTPEALRNAVANSLSKPANAAVATAQAPQAASFSPGTNPGRAYSSDKTAKTTTGGGARVPLQTCVDSIARTAHLAVSPAVTGRGTAHGQPVFVIVYPQRIVAPRVRLVRGGLLGHLPRHAP